MFEVQVMYQNDFFFNFKCKVVPRVGEILIRVEEGTSFKFSEKYKIENVQYVIDDNKESGECAWAVLNVSQL